MADFDYVIVGGGSAGCVLAARLSEEPGARVLLLEAGGSDRNPLFHWPAGFAKMTKGVASWGWSTVPQRHLRGRSLWYTQARVIGGGSTINAQVYSRGNAGDFDAWGRAAGEAWSYRAILPYFKRAEDNERFEDDFHGTGGPLGVSAPRGALPICDAVIRAAQQHGIPYNPDFNGARQAGAGYYQLTQKRVRRSSAATAYLRTALQRPNLTLRLGAVSRRLVVEKGRVAGVELASGEVVRAGREVVLTCGAIGSPRLLMLSGIGPADHLRAAGVPIVHDLPGVGSNLHDHLDLCTIWECEGRQSYDGIERLDRTLLAGLQYLLTGTGPVTSSLFETGVFWYAGAGEKYPDIQCHFGLGSGIEKGIAKIDGAGVTFNSAFMRPRSRGTVRLASADPGAAPLIDPNYWDDPHDREMSLRGLELTREILRQPAMAGFLRREVLPGTGGGDRAGLEAYAIGMAKTQHHPVGTCRMGTDDMAVVAPDLRLRGLDGLRICDASVMPSITTGNTNAPTIMVGEKAADLIRGRDPLPPVVFRHERNDIETRELA